MNITKPTAQPPFKCILCDVGSSFTSQEHIVPESLGNDILVLAKGWVCDACNNICSSFENKVLLNSIVGVERCRLGVMTKKKKPASAITSNISWFAEPFYSHNVLSAKADWRTAPVLSNKDFSQGKILLLLYDETCLDIAKLLLKIGIEILEPVIKSELFKRKIKLTSAKQHILGIDSTPWPYFILRSDAAEKHLVSIFNELPEIHSYILSRGFDIYLHQINKDIALFFNYGDFKSAILLTSRLTNWSRVLIDWGVFHVGCPSEFQNIYWP
jgi:hypothetical protein